MMNLDVLEQMYRYVFPISFFPASAAASKMWTVGNMHSRKANIHTAQEQVDRSRKIVIGMAILSLSLSISLSFP